MSAEPEVDRTLDCDVLVIGAGVSGYCASIQAGRCGVRTVLLEKDEVLGGNSGPNLGVGITGAERYHAYAVETGILQQIREDAYFADARTHLRPAAMGYSISRRFEAVVQSHLRAAGVRVLKRHYARQPIMDGNRIVGVMAEDLAAFRTVRINVSGCVVEASGDGEIGARAGADFDMGSESREEFGERSAPAVRNALVQGTSLVALVHHAGREVRFVPPPGTPAYQPRTWHGRLSSFVSHHSPLELQPGELMFLYVTEAGGDRDTIREDGEIYEELLGQLWAEWDHIKNGPHAQCSRCLDILWVSPKAGKRESRRFLGDYVLTQTDLEAGRRFDDDIAYGGHDLDEHRVRAGLADIFGHSIPPLYGIPFRACYSRNISNLLLAGRLISATHLAHSSTRIMGTGAAVGQAVGLAAALCVEHACTPRQLYQDHCAELQERLLAADGTLLARASQTPDLAREATITATSEITFNRQTPQEWAPLLSTAGMMLWDWPTTVECVELCLQNSSDRDQLAEVQVLRSRREPLWTSVDEYHQHGWNDLRAEAFAELARFPFTVPAGFEGWLPVCLGGLRVAEKDPCSDADRLLIVLSAEPVLRWALVPERVEIADAGERSHLSPRWLPVKARLALRLTPPPPVGEAVNVINGFHRRFSRGPTNMWMSDPADGLPQSLTLTWPQPRRIAGVELTFDTLHRTSSEHPFHSGKRVSDMLVRDYALGFLKGTEWVEILRVEGNIHRFCAHDLEPVWTSQLRLTVLSAWEEGMGARVYQIRVK